MKNKIKDKNTNLAKFKKIAEIPSIYKIPDDVQKAFNELGIYLVSKKQKNKT